MPSNKKLKTDDSMSNALVSLDPLKRKSMKESLNRFETITKQRDDRVADLCKDEMDAYERARKKLHSKMLAAQKDEDVVRLSEEASGTFRRIEQDMRAAARTLEDQLDDVYFDPELTTVEKTKRSSEIQDRASEAIHDVFKNYPAFAKASFLKSMEGGGVRGQIMMAEE